MYFAFLTSILVGIMSGIITGLTPGLHVNLVTLIVISSLKLHPFIIAVYLFSLGITHTFLDAIPAIFLGAPDEDLALLPGHELFIKGAGHEAVKLTVIGSFFTLILGVIFVPLLIFFASIIYSFLKPFILFLLILLMIILFFKSRSFFSLFTFFISGILGLIVLNSSLDNKMLPLFSGLFAVSTLFSSLIFPPKRVVPQQATNIIQLKTRDILSAIFGSSIAGVITSIFPGLSPAQSTALVQPYFSQNKFTYLIFAGGVNTIDFFISLTTLFVLGKARNGALIGIKKIMIFINIEQLIALACVGVLVGCVSVILTLKISRLAVIFINKVNFQKISIFVLFFLFLLNMYFSSWQGLIVLITSSIIGLIPILSKTPRSFSMGVLILPVIVNLVFSSWF
ncbi:tripartite tricarboxylate transporter permease [archaeon]|nr:tripartite tricarboxylate transporter permease [archaeon]